MTIPDKGSGRTIFLYMAMASSKQAAAHAAHSTAQRAESGVVATETNMYEHDSIASMPGSSGGGGGSGKGKGHSMCVVLGIRQGYGESFQSGQGAGQWTA